jgi:hypothetical protein
MRAALSQVYNRWDPDVVFDLHTTNGTRHGYELTYSPPLEPNTLPSVLNYSRENLMPKVRRNLERKFGLLTFDYGNSAGSGDSLHWETFGSEGRYVTNYAGLSGRLGILSEATVYWPLKDRVVSTDRFVKECLLLLAGDSERILAWRKHAVMPKELGLAFSMVEGRRETVRLERLPSGERPPAGPPTQIEDVMMPVWDRFATTRTAKVPRAYYLPSTESTAALLATRHGLTVRRLSAETLLASSFTPSDVKVAGQVFQGHRLVSLTGSWSSAEPVRVSGGYLVTFTALQAPLAFSLFEAESLDGAVAWGFVNAEVGKVLPIQKVVE